MARSVGRLTETINLPRPEGSLSIMCGIAHQPQLAGNHTSYFVGKRFTRCLYIMGEAVCSSLVLSWKQVVKCNRCSEGIYEPMLYA